MLLVNQILTHWYSTMLLSLRYAFHQAKERIISGVWLGLVVNLVKFKMGVLKSQIAKL